MTRLTIDKVVVGMTRAQGMWIRELVPYLVEKRAALVLESTGVPLRCRLEVPVLELARAGDRLAITAQIRIHGIVLGGMVAQVHAEKVVVEELSRGHRGKTDGQ